MRRWVQFWERLLQAIQRRSLRRRRSELDLFHILSFFRGGQNIIYIFLYFFIFQRSSELNSYCLCFVIFQRRSKVFSFFPCDQCRGGQNLIYMVSFFNDNNDDNYRKAVSVSASFLQRLWEDPRLWYDFELHYCTIFLWQWQYRDHLVGQLTIYDFAFQSICISFITNRHYSVQFSPSETLLTPNLHL